MQEQISEQNHEDLGCDGWEISAHGGCAPDHEPIQGRQYSDEEYERINNSYRLLFSYLNFAVAGVKTPAAGDATPVIKA